jgi:alpha-glucosidase (family GH31 glycosyl hydrolase)
LLVCLYFNILISKKNVDSLRPNDKVAYPDFMNERTKKWWQDQIVNYRKVNITFDAIWIDMNEPV